jgi:hypothetical protein
VAIACFGREHWGLNSGLCTLQSRCCTAWATPPVHFSLIILEMESHKLFAQAGPEPWPSQS